MVSHCLNDTQPYIDFFHTYTLARLRHWLADDAVKTVEVSILDQEHERILKAISFGLSIKSAWSIVRDLIIAFTPYMERRGHWASWNQVLQRANIAGQQFGDVDGSITLMALMARLYQRQSRSDGVIYYYRRVIQLARQTNNQFEQARACSNLGFLYIDGMRWWRSEVLSCRALDIFEELQNDHGLAHTHNHLGLLYIRKNFWQQAEYHLDECCRLWQSMNDNHSLIYGFENLGLLYIESENPAKALQYLKKALDLAELTGEEAEIGTIWMNIGDAYMRQSNWQQAETASKRAETIFLETSNRLYLAHTWINLGCIYVQQGKWDNAEKYLKHSLDGYRMLDNKDGEIETLMNLVEFELTRKNKPLADYLFDELRNVISDDSEEPVLEVITHHLKGFHYNLTKYLTRGRP